MVETEKPNQNPPVLQRPPGYRGPDAPRPRPPPTYRKVLPPSFPRRRRSRSRRCCCICSVLILLLLLLAAGAGALFCLWCKPTLPVFRLLSASTPLFRIDDKPEGTVLAAQTTVRIQAANPNQKIRFTYDRIRAWMTADDGVDLGSGGFRALDQAPRSRTLLRFQARVHGAAIDEGVASSLKARHRNGKMEIRVEVRTRWGWRLGNWSVGRVPIRILCRGALKRLQRGDAPACKITLLKWITLN